MATQVGNVIFQISADLKGLQGQLRTMEGNFQSSFSNIEKLGKNALSALGVGLSIGGVVAFGKSILDLGDQLSDLRDQTGLTIEVLGGIKPILDQSNSSLEGFAKGFAKFQKQLGDFQGEGKQAAEALKAIKLNPAQLVNAAPDVALEKLVTALAQVENRNERAAIASRLFGKSAAELIPTILQLAENGIPKLDAATTAAFEKLGKLRDQLTAVTASAANLAAGPVAEVLEQLIKMGASAADLISIFGSLARILSGNDNAVSLLTTTFKGFSFIIDGTVFSVLALYESLLKIARVAPLVAEALSFNSVDFNSKAFTKEIERTEQVMEGLANRFMKQFEPELVGPTKKPDRFKGLLPGKAEVDKSKNELDGFFTGLTKQIDSINQKTIELKFGPEAGLIASLDQQFQALKEKLGAKIKAFPGLEEFFIVLRDKIVEADRSYRQFKQDIENAPNLAAWDALDKEFGTLLANIGKTTPEMAKLQAQLRTQAEELSKTLTLERRGITLEGLSPELRAEAEKGFELSKRLDEIKKWRTDMVNAGGDAAQAQIDASVLAGQAWDIFFNKQKEQADEQSEFTRRAFERGFDAVSDAFKDFLDNGFTSFQDFGKKILRVINSIVADQITLELKKIFLGPDFGKAGAGVGGILGDLFGLGQKPQSKIGGAFDTEEKIWGQMADGTQTAISAATATAQSGLSALQTTAITSIEAVKAVAIAAIQAQQAGGSALGVGAGGLGFGDLFGGGSAPGGAPESMIGGAFDAFELGMWHEGGSIHAGSGPSGRSRVAFKMHSGGDVPIMAQSGEFMVKRWSANEVGRPALDFINKTGRLPGSSGGGPVNINFSVNGANDFESFKRSRPQILADLTRAVQKGQKHL